MPKPQASTTTVNIRPEVSILSVFPHLNYRPWFALAEFVDNSIQSYMSSRNQLEKVEGNDFKLVVSIEFSPLENGKIIIRDNAGGIHTNDYQRAFKTAAIPADRSGLSEFGVGMKSAACWFAKYWSVRTNALGEELERFVELDVDKIVREAIEELESIEVPAQTNRHGTEITLRDLHSIPQGRTIGKIKEHLASIYRGFIHEGLLDLRFNDERLIYTQPPILNARYHRLEVGDPVHWRKDIELDFGSGLRVYGFAALREIASTSAAGFALFRRGRLIQGSQDEGYRPEQIFKKSNSFTYQRLFGELHVEGFEVTHTKDGIKWAEHEEIFLEFLKQQLDDWPLPLLDQAEGYRARLKADDLTKGARSALDSTADAIQRNVPAVVDKQLRSPTSDNPPPKGLLTATLATERIIEFLVRGTKWRVTVQLTTDPNVSDWLSIADQPPMERDNDGTLVRQLGIRVSLLHPFMDRFSGPEPEKIEPILRIAAALALAEITAREGGVTKAGVIRLFVNDLLRNALSNA